MVVDEKETKVMTCTFVFWGVFRLLSKVETTCSTSCVFFFLFLSLPYPVCWSRLVCVQPTDRLLLLLLGFDL